MNAPRSGAKPSSLGVTMVTVPDILARSLPDCAERSSLYGFLTKDVVLFQVSFLCSVAASLPLSLGGGECFFPIRCFQHFTSLFLSIYSFYMYSSRDI